MTQPAYVCVVERADAMTATMQRATVLGLGAIGNPIALRLLAAGVHIVGFDPDLSRRRGFTGETADTAAAAAAGADAILVIVGDGSQAQDALFGDAGAVAGASEGTPVLLMSTLGAAMAQGIADRLAGSRLPALDAAITGGVRRATAGELVIMAGGDRRVLERVRPLLRLISAEIVNCGPRVGDGQSMKTVNQLLCATHIIATAEALALADAMGLDPELVIATIPRGAAQSFVFDDHAGRMVHHDEELLAAIDLLAKDIDIVVKEASRRGVSTQLARCAQRLYGQAVSDGLGRSDSARMLEFIENLPAEMDIGS